MSEEHSNFITPPDILTEDQSEYYKHTVLIIDADWIDVEKIATYCKISETLYNVYLYNEEMDNLGWLQDILPKAKAIIVNTSQTKISSVKDRLAENTNAYYYGPKSFLKNNKQIRTPLDYFTGKI